MTPDFRFVAHLSVLVSAPVEIGDVGHGISRMIPIVGGTVSGPLGPGAVLAGGADFQVHAAGVTRLDARYSIELGDGARLAIRNRGVRHASQENMARLMRGEVVDPAQVYFRTAPVFETAAPAYAWMMRSLFVATGQRHPDRVELDVWTMT